MTTVATTTQTQRPLPLGVALRGLARCVGTTGVLIASGRLRLPRTRVGTRLSFADGTAAPVYRETVIDGTVAGDPCVLVVCFRLRLIRGRAHALFRWESIANTPLFAGFPGFVSKLWLEHDDVGRYRGIYQWDGPDRAESYARALWWVLALVSERRSIRYHVLPHEVRDAWLASARPAPAAVDPAMVDPADLWWLVAGEP